MLFDWQAAIELNRNALLRILATLFFMAGIADGAMPETLPRHRLNAIRRILKTTESALRRLIVIAARDLADIPWPVGVRGYFPDPQRAGSRRIGQSQKEGKGVVPVPPFALTDPPKTFSIQPRHRRPKSFPRISFFGPDAAPPAPIPDDWYCEPDDDLDTGPICRRLLSARRALDDLQREAERLARLQRRRDRGKAGLPVRRSPLRTGRPPGHRNRKSHEADAVLAELHMLAGWALSPDTS